MRDDGHVKVAVGRKAGTANGRAGGRIGKFWGGFLSDVLTHDTVAPCKIAVYTQLQPRVEYKFLALQVFLFFFFFFLQRTYIHGYVQYSTRSRYHRDDGGLGNIIYLFIYYLLTLVLGTYEPVKSATCIPLPPPPKSLD